MKTHPNLPITDSIVTLKGAPRTAFRRSHAMQLLPNFHEQGRHARRESGVGAEFPYLPYMMLPVCQMKLSPLACRQGAESRMVEEASRAAETAFALRDKFVHGGKFLPERLHHLVCGHVTWDSALRSFSSFGKIADAGHKERCHSLLPGRSPGQRTPSLHAVFESFHSSRVGQIKMFQNLGGTPFALGMTDQSCGVHAMGCGGNRVL